MVLAPISQIIEIKRGRQTTLQLLQAIEDPVATVANYVFTPSIREHFGLLFQTSVIVMAGVTGYCPSMEAGRPTFLATLVSLLSDSGRATQHLKDQRVQQSLQEAMNQRLFPVTFNLIGRRDMLNQRDACSGYWRRKFRALLTSCSTRESP